MVRKVVARVRGVGLTVVVAGAMLTGCSFHEQVCSTGEYPAKLIGSTTGSTCVAEGQDPPSGYVRYPKGQEPKYIGDHWDKYWKDKAFDKDGNVVPG